MTQSKKYIFLLTLLLTSFLLGVLFSQNIKDFYVKNILKNQTSSVKQTNPFLQFAGFGEQRDINLDKIWAIYSVLKNDYYDIEGIQKEDIVDGISKGLVEALGDKHSEYMNSEETESFEKMLSGDFEGIGAIVDKLDFGVKIERVLKGSPAEKSLLLKNDVITQANGEELADLTLFDAVAKIKGPAGTRVMLTILRSGEKEALDIEVIRDKIKIPSVEQEYIEEDKIGYIALNLYGDETSSEFKKALRNLEKKNIEGLIIDLRGNGGGYLESAVEILSKFIKKGELVVTTKYKNKLFNEPYYSQNSGKTFDKKIVVLINGSSASASEITAGALREYNKAIIVGEKSYGKGSVQKTVELKDKSLLKLTIAKWFTPLGKNIDGEGVTPDVEVNFKKQDYDLEECKKQEACSEDLEQKDFEGYDRQLEEAKNILKNFIKKGTLQAVVDEENERLGNDSKQEKF